jgi:hypothetical protein
MHHRFSRFHGFPRRNEPAVEPKDRVGERDDATVRMGVWCRCPDGLRGLDFASARLEHQRDQERISVAGASFEQAAD